MRQDTKTNNLNKKFRDLLQIGNESNCRWVFHSFKSHKAKCCVGNPVKKRKTTTYEQFLCESEGEGVDYPVIGGINVFYSVNEYLDYNVNALLWQLHANYIDIDIRNKKTITRARSLAILESILNSLLINSIPRPNAIVASGSGGWHLYWAYSPVSAYKSVIHDWKNITKKIISTIPSSTEYVVDKAASVDPGRVLRLPGTFHFESKDHCECIELSDAFDFDGLLKELRIEKFEYPVRSISKKPKQKKSPHRHNIKDWWAKIYYQLVNHADSGYVTAACHNRDEFIFITYVALKHIHIDEQTAFDKAIELNNRFQLLPEEEAISNLSTARRVEYRFKKETLIGRFETFFPNLDTSFFICDTSQPLSKDEIAEKQSKAAVKTNDKRKDKTMQKLSVALQELHLAGKKQTLKAVSEISGISYTTVKKYKNFLQDQKRQLRSPSIYPPLGGVF